MLQFFKIQVNIRLNLIIKIEAVQPEFKSCLFKVYKFASCPPEAKGLCKKAAQTQINELKLPFNS